MTDYDKLTLELFGQMVRSLLKRVYPSVKIIEHLNLFIGLGSEVNEMDFMVEKSEAQSESALERTIEELEPVVRSFNCL